LPYCVRLMHKEDITQVSAIDRAAFPTMWPPTNFQRELQSRLAHYIVACEQGKRVDEPEIEATPEKGITRLASKIKLLFNYKHLSKNKLLTKRQYIVGFAGFWVMAEEAHIINIAARQTHRRQGIGELLLISVIDMAMGLDTRIVTLEVRSSNTTAQNLYRKYGFTQVGRRQGYYTENREDAILMSTEDITSAAFQAHLQQLKQAHSQKMGITLYQLTR